MEKEEEYSTEDEEEQYKGVSYSKWTFLIVMVLAAFLVFWGGDKFGSFRTSMSNMWALGLVLLWFFIRYSDLELKVHSPKFICNPIHTTWTGRLYPVGNYYGIKMGGYRAPVIGEVEGRSGTIFVPMTSVTKCGKSAAATVTPKPTLVKNLPREIRDVLKFMKFRGPYYWGVSSSEFDIKYADTKKLEQEMKMTNEENTTLRMLSGRVMQDTEKTVGWADRLAQARGKKGFFEEVKKHLKSDED